MGEMKKAGVSGVSFHTHRQGHVFTTNHGGQHQWLEGGTLADVKQEYVMGTADWQQGFVWLTILGDDVYPELVPIKNGQGFFRGCRVVSSK